MNIVWLKNITFFRRSRGHLRHWPRNRNHEIQPFLRGIRHYLVSTPRKHRQWHWDRDVNSDLTNVYIVLEFPRSRTRLGKDCCPVPVPVLVDNTDTFI